MCEALRFAAAAARGQELALLVLALEANPAARACAQALRHRDMEQNGVGCATGCRGTAGCDDDRPQNDGPRALNVSSFALHPLFSALLIATAPGHSKEGHAEQQGLREGLPALRAGLRSAGPEMMNTPSLSLLKIVMIR